MSYESEPQVSKTARGHSSLSTVGHFEDVQKNSNEDERKMVSPVDTALQIVSDMQIFYDQREGEVETESPKLKGINNGSTDAFIDLCKASPGLEPGAALVIDLLCQKITRACQQNTELQKSLDQFAERNKNLSSALDELRSSR